MKKLLLILLLFSLFMTAQESLGQFSPQKMIVEEFTGAWCGWCPDGALILDGITDQHANAIAVGFHTMDSMTTAQSDSFANFYSPAFPQACLNRGGTPISRTGWSSAVNQGLMGASSATVSFDSLAYDENTRLMHAKVKIRFTGFETGDLRIGLLITEDSVVGSGDGYDQTNYLNTQQGHPYYGAGDPIPNYVHRHVFREAVVSIWGIPGIVPNLVNFGTEVEFPFTYGISPKYDINQVHLVAFVSRFDGNNVSDRRILNGEEVHLLSNLTPTNTSIDEQENFAREVRVYPNPASDLVSFAFDLQHTDWMKAEIVDINGKTIAHLAEGIMNQGIHTLKWNANKVSPGLYLFKISSARESIVRRVMIRK